MNLTVKFYGHLRAQLRDKWNLALELDEGATISDLLHELTLDSQIHDIIFEDGIKVKSEFTIMRNGREIRFLDNYDTELSQDDEISFFPAVAGG